MELTKCPVCKGRGVIDKKWPPGTPEWVKKQKFEREPCNRCNGSGIVLEDKKWILKQSEPEQGVE